ncbi:MAG TPA: cobalamin-dependent protein, partial [Nitrospirota bacterium]
MVKKILMISTNREFAPQPVVPVGAAWVAEALSQAGFTVRMLDLTYENDPVYKVIEVMREFMPDGVGVSVRNVDNGDFLTPRSFIPALKDITDALKHETDGKILLGGSGVSVMPVEILEYLGLTFAVVGEGEEAAVSFFGNDFVKNPYPDIPGLVCRGLTHREYERTDYPASPDIVTPRLDRWVDVKRYLRFEPVLPVQGKRGCANRCLYCTYNRIEGRCWRLRDPAAVAEEISASIINTGCRTYEFVDSIFNQPEGYMETLLEEIIRWNI